MINPDMLHRFTVLEAAFFASLIATMVGFVGLMFALALRNNATGKRLGTLMLSLMSIAILVLGLSFGMKEPYKKKLVEDAGVEQVRVTGVDRTEEGYVVEYLHNGKVKVYTVKDAIQTSGQSYAVIKEIEGTKTSLDKVHSFELYLNAH